MNDARKTADHLQCCPSYLHWLENQNTVKVTMTHWCSKCGRVVWENTLKPGSSLLEIISVENNFFTEQAVKKTHLFYPPLSCHLDNKFSLKIGENEKACNFPTSWTALIKFTVCTTAKGNTDKQAAWIFSIRRFHGNGLGGHVEKKAKSHTALQLSWQFYTHIWHLNCSL